MKYQLSDSQSDFIKLLLKENFSPSFNGMLKRVLNAKGYNKTERTRIKEIRLSYIKKKIKPRKEINKMVDDVCDVMNDVTLTNKKLHYINMLFRKYSVDDTTKRTIINRFDKLTTNQGLVNLYNYYDKQLK